MNEKTCDTTEYPLELFLTDYEQEADNYQKETIIRIKLLSPEAKQRLAGVSLETRRLSLSEVVELAKRPDVKRELFALFGWTSLKPGPGYPEGPYFEIDKDVYHAIERLQYNSLLKNNSRIVADDYKRIYNWLKNRFKSTDHAVAEKEMTTHEQDVMKAFEWLIDKASEAVFTNISVSSSSTAGTVGKLNTETIAKYRSLALSAVPVLRWALLFHDLGRNLNREPHSEESARLVVNVRDCLFLSDNDVDCVIWLIRYHDLLGNIYTGERHPQFLLDLGLSPTELNRRLQLLQVTVLCDMRGTAGGSYLTEEKAKFWLDNLSDKKTLGKLAGDYFNWRVQRWTGDLMGGDNPTEKSVLMTELQQNPAEYNFIRDVFGSKISRIVYGFYLFTELETHDLAALMKSVTTAYQQNCLGDEVVLEFPKYKPDDAAAESVKKQYVDQIRYGAIRYSYRREVKCIKVELDSKEHK